VGKKIVVKQDPVRGTDTHSVQGQATNPAPPPAPPTVPWPPAPPGTARFDYVGSMTEALSDLVTIDGVPVALVTSGSTLDPGEDTPPAGKHSGPLGTAFVPPAPVPIPNTLTITDPIGPGRPSAGASSAFFTIGGAAVLLDGDAIDTCDAQGAKGNSTVSAAGQTWVSVTE
jgi:hypothetical protein